MNYNNIEEIYTILYGASNSSNVKYAVLKRWFVECGIIDERSITEEFLIKSYERLCPNREEISLTQFAQLLGILSRESRQEIKVFEAKFQTVKQDVLDEIQERIRNEHRNNES